MKLTVQMTVWKCHDFSVIQILCEINFGDSISVKSAILTHLKARLNFDFYEFWHLKYTYSTPKMA